MQELLEISKSPSWLTSRPENHSQLIAGKYWPLTYIKKDSKRRVIKVLRWNGFFRFQTCIIKEVKKGEGRDSYSRDLTCNLEWQAKWLKELDRVLPLPGYIEFFWQEDNGFLVTNFIKGITFFEALVNSYRRDYWKIMDGKERKKILSYLLAIIGVIDKFHEKGFVHRDITAGNFIIDRREKVWLLDLEITYDRIRKEPNPPFTGGTPGFMSPEQIESQMPTIQEDIYAIGALMLNAFTGLLPGKFDPSDPVHFNKHLNFFFDDRAMTKLMASCLDFNPDKRPRVSEISDAVLKYQTDVERTDRIDNRTVTVPIPDRDLVRDLIKRGFRGLVTPLFLNENGSGSAKDSNPGIWRGISGILLAISEAERVGIAVDACLPAFQNNWRLMKKAICTHLPDFETGLHLGLAGVAIAFASAMRSGLIRKSEENIHFLKVLLDTTGSGLDVACGISGQGMALLQCRDLVDAHFLKDSLKAHVQKILNGQLANGSWNLKGDMLALKDSKRFSEGTAGIICFLLSCFSRFYENDVLENEVIQSCHRGLKYLLGRERKNHFRFLGFYPLNQDPLGQLFISETAGVVITFLKAYKQFRHTAYRKAAVRILRSFPVYPLYDDFSQGYGLAGIGEMYMEAYRVLGDKEWQDKADWIVSVLLHTYRKYTDESVYWMTGKSNFPGAGFMDGSAGILYFLMRHGSAEELFYPLIGFKN